jgi:uncharacterized protein YciI
MPQFIYMVRPPRPTFPADATEGEIQAVRDHFAYLKRLTGEGVMILVGRCEDATFGIAIFEALDESEAREIMLADPAVEHGVFSAELKAFLIALQRGGRS